MNTFNSIQEFIMEPNMKSYENVWIHYGTIANKIGISYTEILKAYMDKNDENYKRQQTGY